MDDDTEERMKEYGNASQFPGQGTCLHTYKVRSSTEKRRPGPAVLDSRKAHGL